MNILIIGGASFIGTNITINLAKNSNNVITLVDKSKYFFNNIELLKFKNVSIVESSLDVDTNFDNLLLGQDIVYHLASTTAPTNSNQQIPQELIANVVFTAYLLEACVRREIKKIIFISSGGTVYGIEVECPLNENTATYPINSYGVQKVTIEKLLYLYQYIHGLDYRVIRLANPYGSYQRPNGILGVITTFVYKALIGEEITLYGDGSVVRDFIYIDDAIRAIMNIVNGENTYRTFNVGCGYGTSINEVIYTIQEVLDLKIYIDNKPGRNVDVPVNYLDIARYEEAYGKLDPVSLPDGIRKTAAFLKDHFNL